MRLAFVLAACALAACSSDDPLPDPTLETAPPAPPTCDVIYVSPNGNDASDGCKTEGPKKTIAAAYATLKLGIHVCHGAYPESLIIDRPIALHGGYDCATWQLDPQGASIVVGKTLPALTVSKSTVDGTATIDGFTFRAPDNDHGLPAVSLGAGTAVHFTSNRVEGGGGSSASTIGSIGLYVGDGASPEIAHCIIEGGHGVSTTQGGSVGLALVGAGRARIHDNTIRAGAGTGTVNAALTVSHSLDLTGDAAIGHNDIIGTTGDIGAAQPVGADAKIAAVQIDATKVELQGNRIDLGSVTITKAPFAHLLANRIHGGQVSVDAEDALVANNMIVGGSVLPAARGVKVFQNTIVAGTVLDTLVRMTDAGPGAFVSGNLLIDGIPFAIDAVDDAPAELADNVFVTAAVVSGLPAVAHGNHRFAASCGADGADVCTPLADCAEATHEKCAPAVLSSTSLFTDGLVPKSDASVCRILQKETVAAGALQIDANGAPRSSPVTAGAVEVDGVVCP